MPSICLLAILLRFPSAIDIRAILSLLASFSLLNPSVLFLSSSCLPVLQFLFLLAFSLCQRGSMAPWQWCGALFLRHFLSYSRLIPFAHAHARPRSSPDWMAPCQPATAIALICSSSCSCPSPSIYISIPLSFSCPIHPLSRITSPPLNAPVCKHAQRLHMCYFYFRVWAANHQSLFSVGGIFLFFFLAPEGMLWLTGCWVITAAPTYSTETTRERRRALRVCRKLVLF